ncbi:glycosyltransferase family 32 protein [Endozoicomonas ascidiicola]|uniref:glycosyltransferase family 32 protein n=1 Tax=Endozoicomonas ascidiicola TaxID=1698521 RepID=UPI0008313F2D|nr:glycosyltransferase [Endozoicomonas ascidiicola]
MIPKIIHYCWFGGNPQPLMMKMCIASWKLRLPDYQFFLWDENRFDVNSTRFTKAAYESKKYAFVSDYVRMHALKEYGGVYLDTDVEVYRSFNALMDNDFFAAIEAHGRVGTSVIGTISDHWLPQAMLSYYENVVFEEKEIKKLVNVNEFSRILLSENYRLDSSSFEPEKMGRDVIFPDGTFSNLQKKSLRGKVLTIANHHYSGSWKKASKKNCISRGFSYFKKRMLPDFFMVVNMCFIKEVCSLLGGWYE